jgi:hypothetical protein
MKKILKNLNNFFHSILLITGILLIFYGLVYLKILGKTETKIKEKVVVRFSSVTEYEVDKPFWWLLEGDNTVLIKNESDETHRGELILKIKPNPCQIPASLYFREEIDTDNVTNFIDSTQKVDLPISFELPPLSEKKYSLLINMQKSCNLSNGDSRKLALKVAGYKFE